MTTPATPRLMPDQITDDTPPHLVRDALAQAFRAVADNLAAADLSAFDLGHIGDPRRYAAVYLTAELADAAHHLTSGLRHTRPGLADVTGVPAAALGDITTGQYATGVRILRSDGVANLLRLAGSS